MILSDRQIKELAERGMIEPFLPTQIKKLGGLPLISYGLGSYGYDIRLSSQEFKIFRHIPGEIVNPKNFLSTHLEDSRLLLDEYGEYFILPAHTYALGFAVELINMPNDVTAIAIGKSTYARSGIIANLTPIEAGWCGYLTIEISNSSDSDCRIFANEGICQLVFLKGEPCEVSYNDRNGKYQGQKERVTLAKV